MGNKRKLLSRRASFLKILDDEFSKKLTIPRTFTKNLDGDIPHWFVVELAGTRKGWRVDTDEDLNGGLYFSYGWSEFVEEQSLKVGDFLLFEYEEPLILQVKIFHKDGTEKTAGSNLELNYEVEGSECKNHSLKARRAAEEDLWSSRHSIRCEEHEKLQKVIHSIEMETADQCGLHDKQQNVINRMEMETVLDYGYGMHEKPHDVNDMAVLSESDDQCRVQEKQLEIFDRVARGMGKVFATEQGVCYTIMWRNVPHLYYYLTFPRAMLTTKTLSNDETVILTDQEGSTWPVKLRVRPGGRVDLVQGWKEFLVKNNVKNGDILTFEFVSDKVIQIHIERAHKTEPMVSFDKTCEEPAINYTTIDHHNVPEAKAKIERVFFHDFASSSFSVTWNHSTRGSYLHIPKAIATKQKLENKDTVLLCDPEGTEWPMKIRTRPSDGRVGLAQGWSTFWRRHKITYGDTLIFEFVSDRVMKVNIIRALPVHPSFSAGPAMKQEVMQQLN